MEEKKEPIEPIEQAEAKKQNKKKTLRGTVKTMPPRVPMLCALVVTVLLLVLRIWQLTSNTNMETGFFLERNFFVYLFFVVAVAGSLATLVLSFLCGKMPSNEMSEIKRPLSGIASLAMAAGFGYETMQLFSSLQSEAIEGLSLYESCSANGTILPFLEVIFGAVPALCLVLYTAACFVGKYTWLKFPAVLLLAGPLWGFCRVVSYFTITTSYLVNAELFCELYAAVFMMLFLFYFARLVTGTSAEPIAWLTVGMGLVAAMMCLLASVPRMVCALLGAGVVQDYTVDGIYLAGCFFCIVIVLSTVIKGVPDRVEAAPIADADDGGDIPVEPFTVE